MAPTTHSVRSKIRQAVLYALQNRLGGSTTIRYSDAGNTTVDTEGYYLNIRGAFDPPKSFEQMTDFPAVNMFVSNETCEDAFNTQIKQNTSLLSNSFTLRLECFIHNENDPMLECDQLLADLQKYFGVNYFVPDASGNATAMTIYYSGSEIFGTDSTRPNICMNVEFKVWYRQNSTNPTRSC